MSYLDSVRFVVTGDRAKAMSYVSYARKMLFDLARQGADSGVITARSQRTLPDGTKIEVSIDKLQATARIDVTGGRVISGRTLVYVTKAGVIRTYDLEKKKSIGEITGLLPPFVVQECTEGGELIYLTDPTQYSATVVRVDVQALTAFSHQYPVNTPSGGSLVSGIALDLSDVRLSPDANLALVRFEFSGTPNGDGTVTAREGIGGMMLVDATTLEALRPAIRMGFHPMMNAWKSDSSRFYLGTTVNVDPGDNVLYAPGGVTLPESIYDYVSVFDAAGVLLGSRLLNTWSGPVEPDAGWTRTIRSMATSPNGERLYVAVDDILLLPGSVAKLYALDITDDAMPIVASVVLPPRTANHSYLTEISVNRAGDRLSLHFDGDEPPSVAEFDLTDDSLELIHKTASTNFNAGGTNRGQGVDAIQNAPRDSLPPFEGKRFFMAYTGEAGTPGRTLRAFSTFDAPPTYEYDFDGEDVSIQYRVFAERPQEKPDDRKRIK